MQLGGEGRRSLFDITGEAQRIEQQYEQFDHSALDQRVQSRHSNPFVADRNHA